MWETHDGTQFATMVGTLDQIVDIRPEAHAWTSTRLPWVRLRDDLEDVGDYYYKQVTGDSGSGAILGDFKGESYGIGPSFLWIPKSGSGKFSDTGTWLHDLNATERMKGDYAVVTLAWQFGASGN